MSTQKKQQHQVSSDVIRRSKQLLSGVVKKDNPPVTDNLLQKPPFRFLHDVVCSVIRNNPGVMQGLYTSGEMNVESVMDRTSKMEFLDKWISCVAFTLPDQEVRAKSDKMVAGQEAEHTNTLLQMFARIAADKVDTTRAVRRVNKGERLGGGPAAAAHKSKASEHVAGPSKSADRRAGEKAEKAGDAKKNGKTSRQRDGKDKGKSEDAKKESGTKRERTKDVADEKKGESRKSKHKDKDKGGEEKDRKRDKSRDKKPSKDADKEGGAEIPKKREGEDKGKEGREKESKRRKSVGEGKERKSSKKDKAKAEVTPADVPAIGLPTGVPDQDQTAQKVDSGIRRSSIPLREPTTASAVLPEVVAVPEVAGAGQAVVTARESLTSPPPALQHAAPAGSISAGKRKSLGSSRRSDDGEPGQVQIILDEAGTRRGEGEDDEYLPDNDAGGAGAGGRLSMASVGMASRRQSAVVDMSAVDTSATAEHGALVAGIIEQRDKISSEPTSAAGPATIDITDTAKAAQRQSVQREVDGLRSSIQGLCRSTNPLGKNMSYIQEDVDSMQKELDSWITENKEQLVVLKSEQEITQTALEPLHTELAELDMAIADQKALIASVKARIMRKDMSIVRMLTGVGDVTAPE